MTTGEKERLFNERVDSYNHQNDNSLGGQVLGFVIWIALIALVIAPIVLALAGLWQRVTIGTVPAWCIWC